MFSDSPFIRHNTDGSLDVRVIVAFRKLTEKDSFYMKLVSWWTKSNLVHSEVIIGNTWISINNDTGFRINELRPLTDKYEYIDIGYIKLLPYQLESIKNFIIDQKDKKYDYMGIILSQVIPINIQHDSKWFCSELCVKLLQMLLIRDLNNFTPSRYSPADLYYKLKDLNFKEYEI